MCSLMMLWASLIDSGVSGRQVLYCAIVIDFKKLGACQLFEQRKGKGVTSFQPKSVGTARSVKQRTVKLRSILD